MPIGNDATTYAKGNPDDTITSVNDSDEYASDLNRGALNDAKDMQRLGKKQELRRNFKFIPLLGFSCTLMSTWEALISSSHFILIDGGPAGFVWVFLATIFAMLAVIASMADMASMAPTSGGQYHWVSEFAPRKYQKLLSYVVGWLCTLGWQSGIAVTGYVTGTLIRALITFNNSSYTVEPWHDTVLTIAIVIVAALVNIFLARHLPWLEGIILILHILGFISVVVPLWVLAPKNSPKRVFTEFNDGGGWGSVGTACIVGQVACITSFMGADSSAHMAEEVRDASRTVARTMISTTLLNGVLGLFTVITFVFAVSDLESALASPTGYPFIEIFYAATGSRGAATTMTAIIIILTLCSCISFVATSSRQTFAFARDLGFFMPAVFSKVSVITGTIIPLNAVLISLTIPIVMALLNLGSSETFFAVISLLVAALFASYFVSIACIFTKRLRGERLPPSRWTMGRWTLPVNVFALCYIAFAFIMTCFPLYRDVTLESMNWSSVVFSAVVCFALVCYVIHGRKIYKGPVVLVKDEYEDRSFSMR